MKNDQTHIIHTPPVSRFSFPCSHPPIGTPLCSVCCFVHPLFPFSTLLPITPPIQPPKPGGLPGSRRSSSSLNRLPLQRPLLQSLLLSPPLVPLQIPIPLRQLRSLIDSMARKQEVICGGDSEGEAHKRRGINAESARHGARDPVAPPPPLSAFVSVHTTTRKGVTYSSGLFCVSITAARGMPKLETGPQKSIPS